jgi:hypothetical protein
VGAGGGEITPVQQIHVLYVGARTGIERAVDTITITKKGDSVLQ